MNEIYIYFLQALKAALQGEKVQWEEERQPEFWLGLFQTAEVHHILPMIYEAVYDSPAARQADPQLMRAYRQRVVQTVMIQTQKTSDFLALYPKFREAGVAPIVVKGIICRNMYPNPDCRISGDEDILVTDAQYDLCHQILLKEGLECMDPDMDREKAYEVPYRKQGSPLYIEVHKHLFPPESEAYGELNRFFEGIEDRTVEVGSLITMDYTDHLFYLICHALKHWLHAGCGIRQVCDIIMMANTYGEKIDWQKIWKQCTEVHAERFTAAVFRIGEVYLNFDPLRAHYPEELQGIEVDEEPLLEDILSGGVYGAADPERQHSSTVTLNAVKADKKGKKGGMYVLRSIFPSAKDLQGRYSYLEEKPYLLPKAWLDRIVKYQKELHYRESGSAAESMKIGERRVELLKMYGVIGAAK